jgi:hypothetical protein
MSEIDKKENKVIGIIENEKKNEMLQSSLKTTDTHNEEPHKTGETNAIASDFPQKDEKPDPTEKSDTKVKAGSNEKSVLKEDQALQNISSISVKDNKITGKEVNVADKIEKTNIKKIAGKEISIADKADNVKVEIHKIEQIKNEIFSKDSIKYQRSLDIIENATVLDKNDLAEVQSSFFYNKVTISNAKEYLKENRMVILYGPEKAGKYYFAQYLAAYLIKEGESTDKDVLVVETPPSDFLFDLNYSLLHTDSLKDRIIIFKEIIANGNPHVLTFLRGLRDINGSAKTKSDLTNRKSYLIFTISEDTISSDSSFIKEQQLKTEVPKPEPEFLKKAFEEKIKAFCARKNLDKNEIIRNLTDEKPDLLTQLETMYSITSFVEGHLDAILAKRKSIDEAIGQINNLPAAVDYWYNKEICDTLKTHQDFECWVFLFCLAFLDKSPWLQFERFYREIAQKIFRELHPISDIKKLSFMLSEAPILHKCRARIMRDISTGKEQVEFLDSRFSMILSRLINNTNKRIISVILDYINELIDNPDYDNISLACRLLGRVGIIAPEYVVFKNIRKWASEEYIKYRIMVADLYRGIRDTQDEHYIKRAMSLLNNLALSENLNARVTAIFVFKNLAEQDIVLCMNELRRIAEKCVSRLHDIKLFDETPRHINDIMDEIEKRLAEKDYLLPIIQYTLVYLCREHDSINVIEEMRKWLLSGEVDCVMLTVFFFLNKDGIADALEYLQKDIPRDNRQNRLITLFWNTNRATMVIINFIRELFTAIENMPSIYHKQFKASLFSHLKTWIEISFENDANWDCLAKFIRNLYKTGRKELKEKINYEIFNWRLSDQRQGLRGFLEKIKEEIAEFEKS